MKLENIFAADFSIFGCIATINLIALVLIYYVLTYNSKRSESNLPPGPRGLPLLGNVLQMVKNPHLKFSEWATEFGKFYTVHLANKPAVFVNDAEWMKELFGTMASTGKFQTATLLLVSRGTNGILNSDGAVWAEQRQFCIRNLRMLGFGQNSSMEPLILHEAHELCEWIRETCGNDSQRHVDLSTVLAHASINALWSLLSGYEYLDKSCKDIHQFVGEKFEEHEKTYVKGQTRDYIEHMNYTNENDGNGESSFLGNRGWTNSVCSVVELFLAGGETMASTLKWAAVYVSHDVEVQRKLQNEIDEVVGRDRDPSLIDRARMPYCEAVILETLRLSSLLMFGHLHELLYDLPFHGYTLPKGTIVAGNLYHIHHDPMTWGAPEKFRPERFLMDEGVKDFLVPFHVGKRQCLGDQLAKDVLFLFLAKMFQQFIFKPVSGVPKEDYFQPDFGISLLPKCSKFVIESR